MASPSTSTSSVQRAIDVILRRIRDGAYVPGQQVIVRELCQEMNLSKAPVREALHVLAGEGVIELLPNRSARIRLLSQKDILDFVTIWAAIGGVNARLAADRIDRDGNREQLERQLKNVLDAAQTRRPYRYFMEIASLHRTLAEISDNVYINGFIARFHFEHYHRHVAQFLPGPHWSTHVKGFRRFCEVILRGEGAKAEHLYRTHLDEVIELLRQEMGQAIQLGGSEATESRRDSKNIPSDAIS